MRCRFCQNYQISHQVCGEQITPDELARRMMALQQQGCHNIEAVTPTPQLPLLVDALQLAWEGGLCLPLVYNCGGYENPEVIRFLDGMVDIYLPDFKYGNEEDAFLFSGVRNYVPFALQSIQEMIAQVGTNLEVDGDDIAVRGLIIRHLVLPGRLDNTVQALTLIRKHLGTEIPISLMSQYTPITPVMDDPFLSRRITRREYDEVVNRALDMGFEQLFVQEVDDRNLCPDFNDGTPFQWEKES
jgi:putative pyruvate formate lyase activating enzyme